MMTTVDTHAVYENARYIVLTDRGHAVRAAYRFLAALRELGHDDRAAVLKMLDLELGDLPATA